MGDTDAVASFTFHLPILVQCTFLGISVDDANSIKTLTSRVIEAAAAGDSAAQKRANDEICVLVQVETREAMAELDRIAAVEGVDGVFIGPADLSAAMGHRGNPGHPEVQAAIEDALVRIQRAGKAAGILSADQPLARRYIELGAAFVAVGVDTTVLMRGLQTLAGVFKEGAGATVQGGVY